MLGDVVCPHCTILLVAPLQVVASFRQPTVSIRVISCFGRLFPAQKRESRDIFSFFFFLFFLLYAGVTTLVSIGAKWTLIRGCPSTIVEHLKSDLYPILVKWIPLRNRPTTIFQKNRPRCLLRHHLLHQPLLSKDRGSARRKNIRKTCTSPTCTMPSNSKRR